MARPTKAQQAQRRNDDYFSAASLLGGNRDPSSTYRIRPTAPLQQQTLNQLYLSCGLSRRIVDMPAEDMTRAGFVIENNKDSRDLMSELETLNISKLAADAFRWKFLFGGSAVIALVNDGGLLEDKLDESNPHEIESLRIVDRFRVSWDEMDLNSDPNDKHFGEVEYYKIQQRNGSFYYVHRSRIHIIDGLPLPEDLRALNNNWGASSLQFCQDEVKRLGSSWQWASKLIERAQQAVHKIPNLSQLAKSSEGMQAAARRADLVDMTRNSINGIVIDKEEEYELKSTSFSGVVDIVDRMAEALCAVTGRPMTLLLGRSPAGMSATGKSDLEIWNGNIMRMCEQDYRPLLEWLIGIIAGKDADWSIKFNSLFVPSDKEISETKLNIAREREIYANIGHISSIEGRKKLESEGWELTGNLTPSALPENGDLNG